MLYEYTGVRRGYGSHPSILGARTTTKRSKSNGIATHQIEPDHFDWPKPTWRTNWPPPPKNAKNPTQQMINIHFDDLNRPYIERDVGQIDKCCGDDDTLIVYAYGWSPSPWPSDRHATPQAAPNRFQIIKENSPEKKTRRPGKEPISGHPADYGCGFWIEGEVLWRGIPADFTFVFVFFFFFALYTITPIYRGGQIQSTMAVGLVSRHFFQWIIPVTK